MSEFPALDRFVLHVIKTDHGLRAFIDSVVEYDDKMTVNYYVRNSNYCQKVKREHGSNRIYYCANLLSKRVYQMCHSNKCINYRSTGTPIPPMINSTKTVTS